MAETPVWLDEEENFGMRGRRRKAGYPSRRVSMIETAAAEFERVSGQKIRGSKLWDALIAALHAALAYSGSLRLANDPKRRHEIAVKAGKARQKGRRQTRRKLSVQHPSPEEKS